MYMLLERCHGQSGGFVYIKSREIYQVAIFILHIHTWVSAKRKRWPSKQYKAEGSVLSKSRGYKTGSNAEVPKLNPQKLARQYHR
jgi:hypothetical protein